MKRINRLLCEARTAVCDLRRPILALIERNSAGWSMAVHLCGGARGSSITVEQSGHAAMQSAVEHLVQLYPGQAVTVIVDDIPDR